MRGDSTSGAGPTIILCVVVITCPAPTTILFASLTHKQVYRTMRHRGVEATVATFGTLIGIASEARNSRRVIQAWGWLRESGLEMHVSCANAYVQALLDVVGGGPL